MEPNNSPTPETQKENEHSCDDSVMTLPNNCDQQAPEKSIPAITDQSSPAMNPSDEVLSLTDLPSEILLHISSFLDAKFVIRTLSRVCELFHSLMNDSTFWKVRLKKRFPKKYPAVPVNESTFDWQDACIQREESYRQWSAPDQTMDYFTYGGYYAPVDAVHLMNQGTLLATGSRDRYLHLVDINKLDSGNLESTKDAKIKAIMDAHKGWIWTIDSVENTLVTGSWDTYIKFWDLAADCEMINKVKLKSAVLCTHYEPNFVAAGSYDKNVYHIDPRQASIVAKLRRHNQPVLCLAADDRFIITGSEDKTVKVYDRRAGSVLKTITLASFPMSMSYCEDQLWVGDRGGGLSLIDASDADFSIVQTYAVSPKGKITGVLHNKGALFTSSTDGTVRVLEPTLSPDTVATLGKQASEVTSICLQNDILVQANSGATVGIWKPKGWNNTFV